MGSRNCLTKSSAEIKGLWEEIVLIKIEPREEKQLGSEGETRMHQVLYISNTEMATVLYNNIIANAL